MDSIRTLFFAFFLIFSCSNAFNITLILSQFKDFSTFNDYLTQTQVAAEINSRQTITILAVDNSAMPSLSGKPTDIAKKIMSVHVVLDYFDIAKLQKMSNKTVTLTTLFQSSGQASGQQGFLNATVTSSGEIVLRSLVSGSTIGANVMKAVVSQPFNVSVLQISTAIVPIGIERNSSSNSTSPSPNQSPVPAPAPDKSPPLRAPKMAPATAPAKMVPATAPAKMVPATAPAKMAPAPSDNVTDASPPTTSPDSAPMLANAPAADAADGEKKGNAGLNHGISIYVIGASLFISLFSMA